MTKKSWTGFFVVIAAVAAGSWYLGGEGLSGADAAVADASYRTATVERRSVGSTVLATGVIRPQVGAAAGAWWCSW